MTKIKFSTSAASANKVYQALTTLAPVVSRPETKLPRWAGSVFLAAELRRCAVMTWA